MTITQQDLVMMQSERMSDAPDAGGLPSNRSVGNNLNALFPPISDVDNTIGRVHLRKIFAGVHSDDPFFGAHFVITDPPEHEGMSVFAFRATKYADVRDAARKQLESYSVASIESNMVLLSTQTIRSKLVQAYQSVDDIEPNVGEVYCLRQDKAGYPFQEEYIRVTDIESHIRTFVVNNRMFKKKVLKLTTANALRHEWVGTDHPSEDTGSPSAVKILETQVADSAKYHGVKALAKNANTLDSTIKVTEIYGRIVPTSLQEKITIDHKPATANKKWIKNGVVKQVAPAGSGAGNIYFNTSVLPGSVVYGDYTDNSDNTLTNAGGATLNVDYVTGVIFEAPSRLAVTAQPAVEVSGASHSAIIAISVANRGTEWAPLFRPIPAPGSLVVDYIVLGKPQRLYDQGNGKLVSATGKGTGNINFASGSASISLGEAPDADTNILLSWSSSKFFSNLDGTPIDTAMTAIEINANPSISTNDVAKPSTVTLNWTDAGGTARTATDDGNGNLTGDATGKVVYAENK